MRRAIERLTFLLLSFAAASLLSFALLARVTDRGQTGPPRLPLLVNLSPRDARDLTLVAVRDAASEGSRAALGRAELARLGGAALPHVLPALESLEPALRGRVALALSPIAFRMGIASDEDLSSPERAVVFFTRFWQDRSADFRAQAVRRKVQRLAERSLALRRKEVVELDTFALAELVEALGPVRGPEDVKRAERLTPVLSHVTGQELLVPPGSSVETAASVVTAWRDWAFTHGADFTTLDGPGRLSAAVMQTRYFRFLASVQRALNQDDPRGAERLRLVLGLGRTSVGFVLLSLFLAVAGSSVLFHFLNARLTKRRAALAIATGVAAAPLAGLAVQAGAVGTAFGIAVLSLGLAALLLVDLDRPFSVRAPLRSSLGRASLLLPLGLSAELAMEASQGRGLGNLTRQAFASRDLATLMWIALVLSAAGCLSMLVPEVARRSGTAPPMMTELVSPARRLNGWIAVALVALLALGGALQSLLPGTTSGVAAAVGRTLWLAVATTAVAGVVAFVLGVLAGGIPRTANIVLARAADLSSALPAPLVACSALSLGGVVGPAALGVLRGLEVAQVLRARLAEQRALEDVEAPSLARAPLSPYLKRVLPKALAPLATSLALSAAWIATFEGVSARLGTTAETSLGTLATLPGAVGFIALLMSTTLVGTLCWLLRAVLPREQSLETPEATVVLALKRRIDSVRPSDPGAGSERKPEP